MEYIQGKFMQLADSLVAPVADLMNLAGLEPWSIGQAIVAVEEGEQPTRPVFAQKAISLIRSHETDGCFC